MKNLKNFNFIIMEQKESVQQAEANSKSVLFNDWKYFFGGGKLPNQEHYYKAYINGQRVEKHTFLGGVKYSIGNMDEAKIKYKTEKELFQAVCVL